MAHSNSHGTTVVLTLLTHLRTGRFENFPTVGEMLPGVAGERVHGASRLGRFDHRYYGLIFEIPAKILARDLTGAVRAIGRDDSDL